MSTVYRSSVERNQERRHGGPPPSHCLERAYELLADGEWHDYYRVLNAVAAAVHPSLAYRTVVSRRKTEPASEEKRAAAVRTGQREIARAGLNRKRRFEQRWVAGNQRQIRLVPFVVMSKERKAEIAARGWRTRKQNQGKPSASSSGDGA